MDSQNNTENLYFILSGVLSLFIYLLFVSILFFIFRDSQKIDISIPTPSSSFSVSLVDIPKKTSSPKPQLNLDSNKDSNKDSNSARDLEKSKLNSASELFQTINTSRNMQNNKKEKSKDSNESQVNNLDDFNKLSEILDKTKNIINNIDSSSNVVVKDNLSSFCTKNASYCKQIQDILYNSWKSNLSFEERLSSIVAVRIDKNGAFSFHIKKYSKNHNFDSDLVESLNALKNTIFPVIEDRVVNLDITFMNKRGD